VASPPDDRVDALYALPLDEFTKARDELAKELRAAGDKEAADEVKSLRKPSVTAWAVNLLAHHEPDEVAQLLDLGDELRDAQESAMSGGGAVELREATRALRHAIREAVDWAAALAKDNGRAVGTGNLDRMGTTLLAATTDDAGRELLQRGRLTEDLEPPGFGGLTAAPPPAPAKAKTKKSKAKAVADDGERKEAETAVRDLRKEADQAEHEAADARRRADDAQAAAELARADADKEAKAAEDAEREAADARQRLEDAERRLDALDRG
jgi:hypothetical protein